MRRMKRALSLFLCFMLLMSLVTINTFAAENDPEDKQVPVSTEVVQQTEDDAADNEVKEEVNADTSGITADLSDDEDEKTEAADEEDAKDAADSTDQAADVKEETATPDKEKDTEKEKTL